MLVETPVTPEQREVQDAFKEVGQKLDGFDRAADIVNSFFDPAPTLRQEHLKTK